LAAACATWLIEVGDGEQGASHAQRAPEDASVLALELSTVLALQGVFAGRL